MVLRPATGYYHFWATGCLVEVGPDAILGSYTPTNCGPLQAQLIRITPDGIKPIMSKPATNETEREESTP